MNQGINGRGQPLPTYQLTFKIIKMATKRYLCGFVVNNIVQGQQQFATKILDIDFELVPPVQLGKLIQEKPEATPKEKQAYINEVSKTEFLDRSLTFVIAAGFDPSKTTIQFITHIP